MSVNNGHNNGNDNGNDNGNVVHNIYEVDPGLNPQYVPPNDTAFQAPVGGIAGFTPKVTDLWNQAAIVGTRRAYFNKCNPAAPLPPPEPPMLEVKEECLLTIAIISEREELERKWEELIQQWELLKEMQNSLGLRGGVN